MPSWNKLVIYELHTGTSNVIPGMISKLLAFSSRLTPSRRLVLAISALVSKEKKI